MNENPTIHSRDEKFKQQIGKRFDLWIDIVDDSEVNEETKKQIKEKLASFRDGALNKNKWHALDDAVYGTISTLLDSANCDKNKEEAAALFENLRDDIWTFFREVKS